MGGRGGREFFVMVDVVVDVVELGHRAELGARW